MFAVGRCPQQADRPAARGFERPNLPDVFEHRPRAGMILAEHGQRVAVVVDRQIGKPAGRPKDAQRGAAAAGEAVDDQFIRGQIEHVAFLSCVFGGLQFSNRSGLSCAAGSRRR